MASSSSGNIVSGTSATAQSEHVQVGNTKPKKSSHQVAIPTDKIPKEAVAPRYWSEYDHPEDGSEDEGYYIYIDPNESTKFPGQETVEKWYSTVRSYFWKPSADEVDEALLDRNYFNGTVEIEDNESTTSGERSPTATTTPRHYGTFGRNAQANQTSGTNETSYFRNVMYGSSQTRPTYSSGDALRGLELPDLHPYEQFKARMSMLCFFASVVILVIVFTLATTGRRKLYEEVDAGIIIGVVANICFAVLGLIYTSTRHDQLSWFQRIIVWGLFIAVCVTDGILVGWMFY